MTPDDLTPDTLPPWPVWCQAMHQWEQRGGLAILKIHTDCTEDDKDLVRATLLKQARDGTMPAELIKTLLSYAFGKPVEVVDIEGEGSQTRTIQITF